MQVTTEAVLTLVTMIVGAGATWLFSLHGRMSRHEAACEQRQKNLDERHETITSTLQSIDAKLDHIAGFRRN